VRAEAAAADRRLEVRQAARAWRRAGAIDEKTRAAIVVAYPDDRARLGPAFRVLVFGFAVVAVSALFGLFGLFLGVARETSVAALLVFFGLVLVFATEVQIGRLRRAQGGTEAATAFLGVGYLLFGLIWLAHQIGGRGGGLRVVDAALMLVVVLCAAAAYRWGYTLFAAAAAAAMFLLAARGPFGRLLWIAGALALAPALARAGEAAAFSPAHRRAARAMAAVSLVFLYLAIHRGSWDASIVERISGAGGRAPASGVLPVLAAIATAIVPVGTLAWGLRTRRHWLIALGALGLVASLVTIRFYVHVAPLWVVLIAGGGFALALAAVLRRYLDSGDGQERAGLTAEPLFTDAEGRSLLELGVGVAMVSPEARPVQDPDLQPGGGRYGGGGAGGKY
jgi:hypothetical protein